MSRRLVHFCTLGRSSGPPGGRPHERLKAGTPREAPTPAPTTEHRPHNSDPTPFEGQNNAESTNLRNHWRGGKSWAAPGSPASTPRFDVPPEQRSWSLNMSWLQFNAGPSPGTCHWLQFSEGPSVSGAPLGCTGETCSLSGETKAPTATATHASCHEARLNRRSLPHFRRRVSSGGALLSICVFDESLVVRVRALLADAAAERERERERERRMFAILSTCLEAKHEKKNKKKNL